MFLTKKQFLERIKDSKNKHKLVNGIFIIKYLDEKESEIVGEISDGKIKIFEYEHKQRFKKVGNKVLTHTRMDIQSKYPDYNFWKPLNISFNETTIEDILK